MGRGGNLRGLNGSSGLPKPLGPIGPGASVRRRAKPLEPQSPDLLEKWDGGNAWLSWRRGMQLAYDQLLSDRSVVDALGVLSLPAFEPLTLLRRVTALTVSFPSKESPEGKWTVTIKPRGTDIAPQPLANVGQSEVLSYGAPGFPDRMLQVDVSGAWPGGSLETASSLIGELVEDTAISATEIVDDENAVILQCVAVYPEQQIMVFDATQAWERKPVGAGRQVLRRRQIDSRAEAPRFRSGRHLVASTAISCNCPSNIGLEFLRLRDGVSLEGRNTWPEAGPSAGIDVLLGDTQAFSSELAGVARQIFTLDWRRNPATACKHCHAVRFLLNTPIEEPTEYLSMVSDYWSAASRKMVDMEELRAPLAHPRFIEEVRGRDWNDLAFRDLDVTLRTASVGDAFGVVPDRVVVQENQTSATATPGVVVRKRFNEQRQTVEPYTTEDASLGDIWVGRGTATEALVFLGAGETFPEPLFEPVTEEFSLEVVA